MNLKEIILGIVLISTANSMTLSFAQKRGPLSLADVQNLLEGRVSQARIVKLVAEEGVSFQLTASLRDKLQKAGADASVIEALAKASASMAAQSAGGAMGNVAGKGSSVPPQSTKPPEKRLTKSDRGGDAKHETSKSRQVQPALTPKATQQVDCSAISKKGQLETLSAEEIEILRRGCK